VTASFAAPYGPCSPAPPSSARHARCCCTNARSADRAQRDRCAGVRVARRQLLASQLFDHERGAFTGALEKRPGPFTIADGGTLFADEIGNLWLEGQAMLLRAIEQGEVRPVGARSVTPIDVRLIATTNRDLERAIQENAFLPDLYDRLSEVVLDVPPLRARREDIPCSSSTSSRSTGPGTIAPRGVSREAGRVLQGHAWPGNARELGHAVSRGVIFAAGD
jgi:transcriptional regulator with GAF, ATPase, and Fis domain